MTEEIFDRINKNDRVVGQTNKTEAHNNGYIHRVIAVYVFNQKQHLLVQDHLKSGLLDHSIGGHVTTGETYIEAAKREAKEELNVDEELEYIGKFFSDETYTGANYKHVFALFQCELSAEWDFVPNDEVKKIYTMSIEEIINRMSTEPHKFTAGFLSTMEYFIKINALDFNLNLKSYKRLRRLNS